jgi:hypothetical protein
MSERQIFGQNYKSEYGVWGYGEDLRTLFQDCAMLKREVARGSVDLSPAIIANIGSAIEILVMATTNEKARADLIAEYERLRNDCRDEFAAISNGKQTIDMSLMDRIESFLVYLHRHTQNVGLGINLSKDIGKKEKMKKAIRKE